jgi:hypothetical protein
VQKRLLRRRRRRVDLDGGVVLLLEHAGNGGKAGTRVLRDSSDVDVGCGITTDRAVPHLSRCLLRP